MNDVQLKQYADLVSTVIKMVATEPDNVVVHATLGNTSAFLEINVAPVDIGRALGKRGKTIRSIRGLMAALSQKLGIKQAPHVEVMVPNTTLPKVVPAQDTLALLTADSVTH